MATDGSRRKHLITAAGPSRNRTGFPQVERSSQCPLTRRSTTNTRSGESLSEDLRRVHDQSRKMSTMGACQGLRGLVVSRKRQ